MKPTVSIIVPCFNAGKTIIKTLISIYRAQKNAHVFTEIIVVDDCSTDSSVKIVEDFIKKNHVKNLTLIRLTQNNGVSFTRNYGLGKSKGKWIIFLDADDHLNTKALIKIQNQEKGLVNNYDLMAFGYMVKSENSDKDYSAYRYNQMVLKGKKLLKLFLSKKINLHISSIVYRRQFLIENNIKFDINVKIAEDIQFIISCLEKVKKSVYDAYHLFDYQIFNSKAMSGYQYFSAEMGKSVNEFKNFIFKYLDSNEKEYFKFYIVNFYVHNLYMIYKSNKCSKEGIRQVLNNRSILKIKILPLNFKRFIYLKLFKLLPISFYLKYCLRRKVD